MKEKIIEHKFLMEVKKIGGLALKFVSPGFDEVPDRIVLLSGGKIGFVEVKGPGGKLRPLHQARHNRLRQLSFKVYILDVTDQIGEIVDEIKSS